MKDIEIAHLCPRPLHAPGSVNRVLARIVEGTAEFAHLILSCDAFRADDRRMGSNEILGIRRCDARRVYLKCMPHRLRERAAGLGDSDQVYWLMRCMERLRVGRPPVILCHDLYKVGSWLRRRVDWPCRIVLTQHGFSYSARGQTIVPQGFDTVVYLSRQSYEFCRQHSGTMTHSVEIIPNIVDTTLFRPVSNEYKRALQRRFGKSHEGSVVFTCVSRLVRKKGIRVLVEAWHEWGVKPSIANLWVVGESEEQEFQRTLKELWRGCRNSEGIRFFGSMAQESVAEILQASDLFLFPTLVAEGMGLALFEAISCGVRTVASRWPVLEECCDGADVIWVDVPHRIADWVRAMEAGLASCDENVEKALARHEWAKRHYGAEALLPRWRGFFRREIDLARLTR